MENIDKIYNYQYFLLTIMFYFAFNLIISIIEAIYIIYMLNLYKSKTNYADPNVTFSNVFLAHPRTHSDVPVSMVCPAGKLMSWIFGTFLIAREFLEKTRPEEILAYKLANAGIMMFVLAMSSINFNVLLYLSPVFVIELVRLVF
jgi:hypothetical protein